MFTKEMLNEWLKCENDFYYFSEKYLGYDFSNFIVGDSRFKKFLCARQTGKTSFLVAYAFWKTMFRDKQTTMYFAPDRHSADEARHVFKRYYDTVKNSLLGRFLTVHRNHSLEFLLENDSRLMFRTANLHAARGLNFNTVIIDEAAYVGDLEVIYTSLYPSISSGNETEFLIATTPSTNTKNMQFINSLKIDEQIVHSNLSKDKLEEIKRNIGIEAYNLEFLGA